MGQEFDLDSLLAPIPGSVCGEDSIHLIEFDNIKDEVANSEGIRQESANWFNVAKQSGELLKQKSKDLRIVAHFAYASFKQNGFEGLYQGLCVFEGILDSDYWEQVYPNRKKRPEKPRAAAFEFVTKRLEKHCEVMQFDEKSDLDAFIKAVNKFDDVDKKFAIKLGDFAPQTSSLKSLFKRLERDADSWLSLKQEETLAEPERQESNEHHDSSRLASAIDESVIAERQASHSQPPQRKENTHIQSIQDLDEKSITKESLSTYRTKLGKSLDQFSAVLRAADKYDPEAYYIARMGKLMQISELPGNDVINFKPENFQDMEKLALEGKYEQLNELIEASFFDGAIFHLGLHRLQANALEALGKTEAAEAVKSSVAMLLTRFPDWKERHFKGGRKFVDEKTSVWIDMEVLSMAPQETVVSAGGHIEPWIEAQASAKQLIAKGEIKQGVALFEQGINTASCARESAYWRFELAQFCQKAGLLDFAISQLEFLLADTESLRLTDWEPELKKSATKILVACHKDRSAKQQYTPSALQAFELLKKEFQVIDPVGALELETA